MSDLFVLARARMRRIEPFFPLSQDIPRVDNRKMVSGIVYAIRSGLMWKDAPRNHSPHKTLYNRFVCWSRMSVFDSIFAALAAEADPPERLPPDAARL